MIRNPAAGYIAPFALYIAILAAEHAAAIPPEWGLVIRSVVVTVAILWFSWPYLSLRPARPLASLLLGAGVFLIWIGPDLLFHYRHHWLFENFLAGRAVSTLAPAVKSRRAFLTLRVAVTAILVPILEELFWRGWLMRWLIDREWMRIPLGTYARMSFWVAAVLFASEHGPYWEVGLLAGIAYNWWIIRTRNLADCMLAHAVTNALLAAYVILQGQWQYWL